MENSLIPRYLISVVKDDKVLLLTYSRVLDKLVTVFAVFKNCEIEVFDMLHFCQLSSLAVTREWNAAVERMKTADVLRSKKQTKYEKMLQKYGKRLDRKRK